MRRPTDDELDGFLDVALAKAGVEDVTEVEIPECGEGFALFLRPLSRSEYIEYANGAVHDETRTNARTQATMRAALWPSRAEISAAREVFGGLDSMAVKRIEWAAGCPKTGEEEWFKLDASVDEEQLAEFGISDTVAADLRTRYPSPGHLWICRLPKLGVVLVVHRLGARAMDALHKKIQAKGEFYGACLNAAVDAVAWPASDAVRDIFTQHPALPPTVIFPKLCELTKSSAPDEAKKVVRSGRRTAT